MLRLAHRAYLLDEGRVVLAGSGRDLLGDPRLRRTLLELAPEGPTRDGGLVGAWYPQQP